MFIISVVVVVRKNHRCVFFIGIEGAAGIGSSCCCLSCCCGIILATGTTRITATSVFVRNSVVALTTSAAVRVICNEAASSAGAATAAAVTVTDTNTAETSASSCSASALD